MPLLTAATCSHKKTDETVKTKTSKQVENQSSIENPIIMIETDDEFDSLIQKPTIVKFTAEWCSACKGIQPLYTKIAQELHNNYQFITVDLNKLPKIAKTYKIRGIPVFLFFDKGKQLKGEILGARITKQEFLNTIKKVFNQ